MLGAACAVAVIALGPPVTHHNAGVTPLAAQNCCNKVIIAGRPVTVQRVIGCHNGAGMPLFDGNFKAAQIDFPQSTFRYNRFNEVTPVLLIVRCKMFDGSGYTPAVHPAQLSTGHFAGQQRIFREILEVAAVQRMAVNVDARAKQRIHMVFAQLQPFHRVEFLA